MRKPLPDTIAQRLAADRRAAFVAADDGRLDEAWRLLEETHILSQRWAWPHVRSHLDMLRLALRTKDREEMVGQVFRVLVAAPGTVTGKYPEGNTGRANVSATRPMPIPDELAELLATA
jgi:hypothetical protein